LNKLALWANLGAALLCAATLAGCGSTPPAPQDPPQTRPNEPADPNRRAAVRMELAGLYFGRGQFDTALGEINQALAAKPDMPEAFSLRGLVYSAMGDTKAAEESFQRGLQLAPADGNIMHNYAWFLCQNNRQAESEAQFNRALAQPQYRDVVRTQLAMGVCQARAGRWADAEASLTRAYQLDSANPVTAYNLAEVLLRRGELERARFYVRRVNSQTDQVSAQSLWLAARIERRLGNFDALQDHGRQLRERFPQSSEAAQFERGRFDD
jgi:type IV pilus assembly protein PilF